MGREINAAEFKELVRAGTFEKLERTTVTGEVSYRGETIPRSLRLLYVTFLGPVYFTDARIDGTLDLTGCWFTRTLSLSNTKIDGSLIIDDVIVEATARKGRGGNYDSEVVDHVLSASGLSVMGELSAAFLVVVGRMYMSHAKIGGDLSLKGFDVREGLSLAGSEIKGTCTIAAAYRSDGVAPGHISGSLSAHNLNVIGNLAITGVDIEEHCYLWSANIQGNLWVNCTEFALVVPTVIGRDLHIGASTIRGHVTLEAVIVDGSLKLSSSEIGPLRIGHSNNVATGQHRYCGCRLDALSATNLKVHGDASLYNLTVTGLSAGSAASVALVNARVEGRLGSWSPTLFADEGSRDATGAPAPESRRSFVVGDVDLTGIKIDGECTLTNLCVDGSILLNDAEVRDDVLCQSAVSLLVATSTQASSNDLYKRLIAAVTGGADNLPAASVRRISMVTMRCHNDVDLTGLELRATNDEVRLGSGCGNIDAHGINVSGDLWLYRRIDAKRWQQIADDAASNHSGAGVDADAVVPGCADFSGAKIGHLSISGKSFQNRIARRENPGNAEKERGLILSGTNIEDLEIQPLDNYDCVFPVPVNFADIEVRLWNLQENDNDRFRRYSQLLESDATTRRSTYMAVERSLRNRGYEHEADQIYRAMVRRVARENRRFLRWPSRFEILSLLPVMVAFAYFELSVWWFLASAVLAVPVFRLAVWFLRLVFWDWLLGFGTAPVRIGIAIVALFVMSVALVYSDKRNIEPSLTALIADATAGSVPKAGARPESWNIWDALAIGLRTVPLASWGIRDEWQLASAEDHPLYVAMQKVCGARPEDFGMLMMVLNFLAWPPFLAFALRRAFRYA